VTPRLALMIGAAAAFAFGIALIVFPVTMLTNSGLAVTSETVSLSRGAGATLVGLGVIDWSGRNATGATLRGLLVGNLVVQALSFFINAGQILTGQLPTQAAGALIVHLALGAVFVLAMRPTR
jgi:hypothetical protein